MLIIKPSKIYISSANVDMRNSIDGLSAIVEHKFKLDVFSDTMFVFHNRHCDKIKLLYWDGNGFCLLYKRIEHGKFHFPKHITEKNIRYPPKKWSGFCRDFTSKRSSGITA